MKHSQNKLLYFFVFILIISARLFPQTKEFTVEQITSGREFRAKQLFALQWYDNGNKFSYLKVTPDNNTLAIYGYDIKTGEEKIIVSKNDLKEKPEDTPFNITNYLWSPNGKYILFTGVLPARKIKSGGAFYIYDLSNKKFSVLAESNEEQMNAVFSPDGDKLAFVRGNNLFAIDIATGKETQLTTDGSDVILNGHFDWVYEEEFAVINGIEWSPDSKRIAFWRLDQSNEPIVRIQKYDSLHLNFLEMRYPEAGDKNAIVKIGVADLETKKINWMDIGNETDIYIPRIKFTADTNLLSIQRLNRLQNKLELLFADVNTGKSKVILTDTDSCWVDVSNDLTFLKDGKRFIWSSDRDNFKHLYLYDYNGKMMNQITKGNWEIFDLIAVDDEKDIVYYTSNERGVIYKDLYSIKLDGSGKKRLTNEAGYHEINFSTGMKNYIDVYSNVNSLPSTFLCNETGDKIKTLINANMSVFKDYNFIPTEFFTFKTHDGVELNAMIIKPANFDSTKKYPVLFHVYGGPGYQMVIDQWKSDLWGELLANKGYIYFSVDNRETGGRGKAFRNLVYKKFGYWEANDFIEAAKYLADFSYVDASRIGIWGWSYGGYISALTLMKGADYFKLGIAVAPVTDWKFYDNIYTERYMSLPSLNEEGYEMSSVINYADNLKGKFLLVHGTADDNVHFQNTVKLAEKLIELNKPFRTMFYPEKDHSIYGGLTRTHLYNMMTEFILNEL